MTRPAFSPDRTKKPLLTRVFWAAFDVVGAVDSAARRCVLYRAPRDRLLDTLFGPVEEFDYVSRTAPSSPPPTY